MAAWVESAGDVASAATALGGLLLVFIGFVTTGFDSYDATQQGAVRRTFLIRGSLALLGFFLSLVAAALALGAKISASPCLVMAATACLGLAFVSVCAAAVVSMRDLAA